MKHAAQIIHKREVWRAIPGIPNYEASSLGNVRYVHVLSKRVNFRNSVSDKELYELVIIRGRRTMVHTLVATAFNGPKPLGMITHHWDHNKRNNKPGNLGYVTPSLNTRLAYAEGRIGRTVKLTAFARSRVVEMYESGKYSSRTLAAQFRVSRSTILGYLRRAEVKTHRMKKLTPAIYAEIRRRYVPFKHTVSMLAIEYKLSTAMVEAILGMRAMRKGRRLPHVKIPNKSEIGT